MQDLMLDLETLGTGPDAAILSIGAVLFDPMTGITGPGFYQAIDIEKTDPELLGSIDAGTVKFWARQDDKARAVFDDELAVDLAHALCIFSRWLDEHGPGPKLLNVWGNGASYDNVILRSAYDRLGSGVPWCFWNDRDVRTVVDIGRRVLDIDPKKTRKFEGVQHNALDDAIHQALYVSEIHRALYAASITGHGPTQAATEEPGND